MAVHSHRTHSITTYNFEQMYPGLKSSLQKTVLYTLWTKFLCYKLLWILQI